MPSRNLKDLDPVLVEVWEKSAAKWAETYPHYPKPIITCTYRSNAEQTELYAQGRTVKGKIVTRAKAGQSPHNFKPSYAFDIAFVVDGVLDWRPMLFEKFAGLVDQISDEVLWGGRFQTFSDRPHFERKSWKQLVK